MNASVMRGATLLFVLTAGCSGAARASSELAFVTPSAFATDPVVEAHGGALRLGGRTLWRHGGDGPIDGVRVERAPGSSRFAVVFRQGDGIWVGMLDAAGEPSGALRRLNGRGRPVGRPLPHFEGEQLYVAWADGRAVEQVAVEAKP